jgi:hypothetical protein
LTLIAQSEAPSSGATLEQGQLVIVTARREVPNITPERQLGQDDIEAYGLGSIGELIGELSIENGDNGGNTVILVNGRPVSDLGELSDYPPEALERVDVLGVGAGVKVGQPNARRVYNLVLQKSFDGRIGRAAIRVATEGGWSSRRADASYTRIRGQRRLNLRLGVRDEDELLESERGIRQPPDSVPRAGDFRSLAPRRAGVDLSASGATPLLEWLDLSASAKLSGSRSESLLGFSPLLRGPREQERRILTIKLNATLNGRRAGWDLTLLGRYEQDWRGVFVDNDQFITARDRTLGMGRSGELEFTAERELFELPAGSIQLTVGANATSDRTINRTRRSDLANVLGISERSSTFSTGLIVPIASRASKILPILGELNLAANFGVTRFSGTGPAFNRQFSVTWQPAQVLRLFGTLSRNSAPAPGFSREPLLETPGVRYFDPARRETIDVIEISGGVPTLARQRSVQRQTGLTFTPQGRLNLRLSFEYGYRSDRNLLAALPQASLTILELFPNRFVRDREGQLASVDVRPVLFAGRTERELRSGINLSLPVGKGGPSLDEVDASEGGDGDEKDRTGPRTRLQLSLSYTYLLSSKLDLGKGGALIDLLSRRAIAFGGGRPRHQLDGSLGISSRGIGARVTGSHRSRSFLELGGDFRPDVLRFGSLTLLNLRAFANGNRLFGDRPWARSSRVSLSLLNLTNRRQRVRDETDETPLAFQPAYRDAIGRSFELEFRKSF